VITQSDLREALTEYLAINGGNSFPNEATITYLGPKVLVYDKKSKNNDLVVIVWEE
jgi:hypothetical protein